MSRAVLKVNRPVSPSSESLTKPHLTGRNEQSGSFSCLWQFVLIAALQVLTKGIGYGGVLPYSLDRFGLYLKHEPTMIIADTRMMPVLIENTMSILENPMEDASILMQQPLP
jgi:hypothetical protein